ncbi:unnamed protein product [Bursaphelenchus xylophilus]|uniref:(pine wood nematode) hypothetical protein n=1 Tax=Bursaphelenchus xylophilus TaxID=6326 RepID=A0A1I7S687_BURXY|nr:unnamed protein product [Bursaphelenchus xylophilus]CAG9081127.1 unnamed protein product [Bursaphelenchus xylophilus]
MSISETAMSVESLDSSGRNSPDSGMGRSLDEQLLDDLSSLDLAQNLNENEIGEETEGIAENKKLTKGYRRRQRRNRAKQRVSWDVLEEWKYVQLHLKAPENKLELRLDS